MCESHQTYLSLKMVGNKVERFMDLLLERFYTEVLTALKSMNSGSGHQVNQYPFVK